MAKSVSLPEGSIVKTLVTDLAGGLKEIIFPGSALNAITGRGMAYDGSSFSGINNINSSDAILWGDIETLVEVPECISDTEAPEFWIMCNILTPDGEPHPNCARTHLIERQKELGKLWKGGEMCVGAEPEAFFVSERNSIGREGGGNANYFNPKDPKSFIIAEIMQILPKMGYTIERGHPEVGDEQFEINWEYDTAHRTADRIQMYKLIAHKVARRHGFDVTFLPKPFPQRNGSGMHCHLSVGDGKKNLFYDAKKKDQKYFSDTALHFLAGIMRYSRAIAAVANSTEASYARLTPGFEAPCVVALGEFNRSAAGRIPAISDPKTISKALRVEFRFPDPLANPYLLCSSFVVAGILGIEKEEKFKGFTEENLYRLNLAQLRAKRYKLLPRNLWEAYQDFVMNPDFIDKMGKEIHGAYADIILEEIDECQPYANMESMRRHYFD